MGLELTKQPDTYLHLGRVVATPGAVELVQDTKTDPAQLLLRHASGDWGELCDEDRAANRAALRHGLRVMSVYHLQGSSAQVVWIITEGDRSVTTLLLPEDY
ncbi:MAG: hypothetical protein P1P84_02850 [Deferrisomatales bacterium]|nr:hypothetical protein [Deferrisomatales bacterium]